MGFVGKNIVPEKGVIALLFVKKAVTLENIKVYLVIVVKKLTLPALSQEVNYEKD